MHSAVERAAGPRADSGVLVRREIARVNRTERRVDSTTARVCLTAARGVAARAVADAGEIFAALNLCGSYFKRRVLACQNGVAVRLAQQRDTDYRDHDNAEQENNRARSSQILHCGTPPHLTGSGASSFAIDFAGVGTGCADSHAATALTSSGNNAFATSAMQSGACARRWPARHAPN